MTSKTQLMRMNSNSLRHETQMNISSTDYSSLMNCNTKTKRKQQKKTTQEQRKVTLILQNVLVANMDSIQKSTSGERFLKQIFKKDSWKASILKSFKLSGENKYVFHTVRKSKVLLISKIFTSMRRQCYTENHKLIIDLLNITEMTGN